MVVYCSNKNEVGNFIPKDKFEELVTTNPRGLVGFRFNGIDDWYFVTPAFTSKETFINYGKYVAYGFWNSFDIEKEADNLIPLNCSEEFYEQVKKREEDEKVLSEGAKQLFENFFMPF